MKYSQLTVLALLGVTDAKRILAQLKDDTDTTDAAATTNAEAIIEENAVECACNDKSRGRKTHDSDYYLDEESDHGKFYCDDA
jgi:hypothetical protein